MEDKSSQKELKSNNYYLENKKFSLSNYKCGSFYFSSNFDSGNLGRVEILKDCSEIELPENAVHVEFNVWTVPDCFGTSNETPNRTWFFFSIKGGRYYQNVKINVKNLNRQAKLFSQGMAPVMKIGKDGHWHRIKDDPTYQNEDDNFVISFIHKVHNHPDIEIFYAFTYPFSYKDCLNLLNKFDEKYLRSNEEIDIIIKQIYNKIPLELLLPNIEAMVKKQISVGNLNCLSTDTTNIKDLETFARKEMQNEIYYHRELLIKSLEGRRIDLLTITSFHGIQGVFETKMENLFPETTSRCHAFKNKKVIFLSSRVHPGETPASFVLNGFLNLILDKKNPVSINLRRMYVFKIVPILNPDGVYHGYYRTDTLGQNLNRMYMDTKIEYHPSIYAVKKLIKFYQNGAKTCPDIDDVICDIKSSNLGVSEDGPRYSKADNSDIELNELAREIKSNFNPSITSETEFKSEVVVNDLDIRAGEDETLIKRRLNQLYSKRNNEQKINKKTFKTAVCVSSRKTDVNLKDQNSIQSRFVLKKISRRTDSKPGSIINNNNTNSSSTKMPKNITKIPNKAKIKCQMNTNNISLSSCSLNGGNSLFLYIDMHGHASKKGVFMYGNHFSNFGQAVECMLLPKLMTINSQHFHFDACNFSEKNMYRKEKRDGLSKEGSGRVTIYKMTGLVKSYTLECNYNCGKYINILPSKNNIYSKQIINAIPPKYTPCIFEEVGRALGASILDLTNSNNSSRLPNSEYRTLQGIRSSLRYEVDKTSTHSKSSTTNVSSKVSCKRRENIAASTNITTLNKETKENYSEVVKRWNVGKDTAGSSSTQTNTNTILQQPKINKQLKITTADADVSFKNSNLNQKTLTKPSTYKLRSSSLYGKKGTSTLIKKKHKVLVESFNSSNGEKSIKLKEHNSSSKYLTNIPIRKVQIVLKSIATPRTDCKKNYKKSQTPRDNQKEHDTIQKLQEHISENRDFLVSELINDTAKLINSSQSQTWNFQKNDGATDCFREITKPFKCGAIRKSSSTDSGLSIISKPCLKTYSAENLVSCTDKKQRCDILFRNSATPKLTSCVANIFNLTQQNNKLHQNISDNKIQDFDPQSKIHVNNEFVGNDPNTITFNPPSTSYCNRLSEKLMKIKSHQNTRKKSLKNVKVVRNHNYRSTKKSKIRKKRIRGLDSIVIKHKNKLQNKRI